MTGISPTAAAPGDSVTITGSNFPSATSISLDVGGVPLPATTGISSSGTTTITFIVPAMPSVSGPVTVHTPGGQATSSASFTLLNDLAAVAWSGMTFTAVGANASAFTSPDGAHWTPRATGADPLKVAFASVMWAGGRFLAGASNTYMLSSTDGVTWTALNRLESHSAGAGYINAITFTGAAYFATGTQANLWSSSDGSTWTLLNYGQPVDSYQALLWADAQLVAVGDQILTSPDGSTWTQRVPATNQYNAASWSGTTFAVVGSNGAVLTSPDGVTWTSRTSGTTAELRGVIWFGGKFVAVGAGGTILTSPDGITWTPRTSGTLAKLNGVAASSSLIVAVGARGTTIWSPDGLDWTSNLPPPPTGLTLSGARYATQTVAWNAVTGATSYIVYASTGSVTKTSYQYRWTSTGASLQATGIPVPSAGTWFNFIVTAVNGSGEGPASPMVSTCLGATICG